MQAGRFDFLPERRPFGRAGCPGLHAASLVAAFLLLVGCNEDLSLVSSIERPFTFYGVLNPARDTQYVFVFPIEGTLQPGQNEKLEARVSSSDAPGGAAQVWSDSLIQDERGQFAHLFWRAFRPDYDRSYRITAQMPDGRESYADVKTPGRAAARPEDPRLGRPVFLPVVVEGAVPRLLKPEVKLVIQATKGVTPTGREYLLHEMTLPLPFSPAKSETGWRVTIDLTAAHAQALLEMTRLVGPGFVNSYGVELMLVTLDAIAASEDWNPPDGVFDPDVLIIPEVMTNVTNGFGFIGSGYRIRHQWKPSAEVMQAAGFNRPGD